MTKKKDAEKGEDITPDASTDKALVAVAAPEDITHGDGARVQVTGCYVAGADGIRTVRELLDEAYGLRDEIGNDGCTCVEWDSIAEWLGRASLQHIPLLAMESAEIVLLDGFGHSADCNLARKYGLLGITMERETRETLYSYILARAPTAEVLFNKARELGAYPHRTIAELNPAERASLELAVRIGPAIKGAIDAVMAEADARHPPPKIPLRSQPVDVEDTIFEQVHGGFEREGE